MIPLRLRQKNKSKEDTSKAAINQYPAFRTTFLTSKQDDFVAKRGPGYVPLHQGSIGYTLAQQQSRPHGKSLYRTDRFDPTNVSTAVSTQLSPRDPQAKYEGNIGSPLKSSSPRMKPVLASGQNGPGTYHPENFHGAFPILLQHVTPQQVFKTKQSECRLFEATFGKDTPRQRQSGGKILGQRVPSGRISTSRSGGPRPTTAVNDDLAHHGSPIRPASSSALAATGLVAALSPRNAYKIPNASKFLRSNLSTREENK